MLKKSASIHGLWRVTREICEKGATWTDWVPTSFGPYRSSCPSRAIILRECSPVVSHVRTLEVLARQHSFSAAC